MADEPQQPDTKVNDDPDAKVDDKPETDPPKPDPEPSAKSDTDNDDDGVDHKAAAEKWKAIARKQEQRAKDNATAAKELDALKRKSMSDQEKAVAKARDEGAAAVRVEYGQRLASAEIRAVAAGKVAGIDELIDDLNLARYVDDDGHPDSDAIKQLVARLVKAAPASKPADLKQGQRGKPAPPPQDANAWLRGALQS